MQGVLGQPPLVDIVDDGMQEIPAPEADGPAEDLHLPDLTAGEPVLEEEMHALFDLGSLQLSEHGLRGQPVDVRNPHARKDLPGIAVVIAGGIVGLHDLARFRIEKQHDGWAVLEEGPVTFLAVPKGILHLPCHRDVPRRGVDDRTGGMGPPFDPSVASVLAPVAVHEITDLDLV